MMMLVWSADDGFNVGNDIVDRGILLPTVCLVVVVVVVVLFVARETALGSRLYKCLMI